MTLPSAEYQRSLSHQVATTLPQTVDGARVEAVYPKSYSDIAANGISDPQDVPRLALIHSVAEDCLFSISADGTSPFCPIPSGVLLLIHVPAGEQVKVSKPARVNWL